MDTHTLDISVRAHILLHVQNLFKGDQCYLGNNKPFNLPRIVWRLLWVPDPIHDPSSVRNICIIVNIDRRGVVSPCPEQRIVVPAVTELVKIVKIKPDATGEIFQLLKKTRNQPYGWGIWVVWPYFCNDYGVNIRYEQDYSNLSTISYSSVTNEIPQVYYLFPFHS